MNRAEAHELRKFMQLHFKSHPWHGISPHANAEGALNVYVEVVPTDTVKYEIDKATGHLKVDRPQKYSSLCPTLYGFIPRTYCGPRVAQHTREALSNDSIEGDGDPLDICVFTEKPISHADILVTAIPIGGFRMIDRNQADDKILAVLRNDLSYGGLRDIREAPQGLVDRLRHYFLTYKELPDEPNPASPVHITHTYGRDEALRIIDSSLADYQDKFGAPEQSLIEFLEYLMQQATATAKPSH
jgi:inorganic pyrophosphatase